MYNQSNPSPTKDESYSSVSSFPLLVPCSVLRHHYGLSSSCNEVSKDQNGWNCIGSSVMACTQSQAEVRQWKHIVNSVTFDVFGSRIIAAASQI